MPGFSYRGFEFQPPVSERMLGLAAAAMGCHRSALAAGAIYYVTRREDYRRPYRAAMLVEAKRYLLVSVDAPANVRDRCERMPIREWHPKARATVRARLDALVAVGR